MIRPALLAAAALLAAPACAATDYTPAPFVQVSHADWTRDAVLYQINTRQFTREGTFRAAQAHLPRLADMGVDILWLMPIHPIGAVNRKGGMGSPYSVRDYRAVNPDLGTEADLRAFVDEAHRLGMKVILDWVANHSAWDNPLTASHPEWYARTPEGAMMPPLGTDWSDVVAFDYRQPALRAYMTGSLTYWVREFGIDGYRADVAGFVPTDFWETARAEMERIKPVFMLAEWEQRDLHARAFDATYAWTWKDAMKRAAKATAAEGGAGALRGYYAEQANTWPRAAYRMVYTDNHDQNAWDGVAADIYGPAHPAAMALAFTGSGMPLIHNGQEADLAHQLAFFEKDEIKWQEGRHAALLKQLVALKTRHSALWNGEHGAPMVEVPTTDARDHVFAFTRGDAGKRVFAVFNLAPTPREVTFQFARHHGAYADALTGAPATFAADTALTLPAWGFRIFAEDN